MMAIWEVMCQSFLFYQVCGRVGVSSMSNSMFLPIICCSTEPHSITSLITNSETGDYGILFLTIEEIDYNYINLNLLKFDMLEV